jgi:multiple sugar transport system substrate-binding protein
MAAQHEALHELTIRRRAQSITRRSFLERATVLGLSSGAALALLEGCSSPITAGGDHVGLTYWNLFGGGDGVRMIQMEDAFSASHPNTSLKAVTLSWGEPYYTKVAMSAAGGRSPDVAISHITRMSTYAAIGFLDPFDLNELAKVGITEQNFLPEIWQRGQYNGKLYAVPLDTHPFVMYYNTDVAKKAGLLDADGNLKPLQGPTELIDAFKKAQQVTGYMGVTFLGPWRLFSSLYGQQGGVVLSPDAKSLVMDDQKALQALDFMTDLTLKSKVCPPVIDSVALFGSGKAGFYWNGEWEVSTFITQKTPFSMIPFPNVFGNNRSEADSHSFILPHQDNPDPAKRAASYEFIATMLKESLTWAQGGHIPAYLPVTESTEYKNLKPQSNYADAAKEAVLDPSAWFSGSGSQLEAQGDAAFQAVMSGQLTPQQGLQQFKAAIQKLIDTPSPL